MKDADFYEVKYPTYSRSACSPEIPADFEGIILNAPREVDLSARQCVPICGGYRLRYSVLKTIGGSPIESVVLNFVDQAGKHLFSFNLQPDKDRVEKPKGRKGAGTSSPVAEGTEVATEHFVKGYFNIDVLKFYPRFPRSSAEYVVYGVLKSYKSNSLEMKVSAQ